MDRDAEHQNKYACAQKLYSHFEKYLCRCRPSRTKFISYQIRVYSIGAQGDWIHLFFFIISLIDLRLTAQMRLQTGLREAKVKLWSKP